MDVSNIGQKVNLFTEIDKKITIKYLKEVRTSRTYITGMSDFLSQEEISSFVKILKKKLGAGMLSKKIEVDKVEKVEYGFQGNHMERIKKIMLEETNIPEEKIKIIN